MTVVFVSGYSLQEAGDNNQFCWRNLFSCINLLRILNKLTKWKHSRTMVSWYCSQSGHAVTPLTWDTVLRVGLPSNIVLVQVCRLLVL